MAFVLGFTDKQHMLIYASTQCRKIPQLLVVAFFFFLLWFFVVAVVVWLVG